MSAALWQSVLLLLHHECISRQHLSCVYLSYARSIHALCCALRSLLGLMADAGCCYYYSKCAIVLEVLLQLLCWFGESLILLLLLHTGSTQLT